MQVGMSFFGIAILFWLIFVSKLERHGVKMVQDYLPHVSMCWQS
ncbi:hypothetical protein [Methanosarcina sp. UBA5]|nr:hypothetical protein [Methanosarcina sp. UBA5]